MTLSMGVCLYDENQYCVAFDSVLLYTSTVETAIKHFTWSFVRPSHFKLT